MENIARVTIGAAVGTGVVLVGIPAAIGALGFTSAGIAAGSVAAKMMSAAAIANGGGVAAGSTVAVLQSIGAAGFSLGTKIGLGTLGSAAGAKLFKKSSQVMPRRCQHPRFLSGQAGAEKPLQTPPVTRPPS